MSFSFIDIHKFTGRHFTPGATHNRPAPIKHRDNSFNLIRLIAACMVVVSHFYIIGGTKASHFRSLGFEDIGELAVMIFFAISGYLVSQSWIHDPSPWRFLQRRILRIFPALIAVILITIFIIGPVFSDLTISEYFHKRGTWRYLENITLYMHHDRLPGVFLHKAQERGFINSPLWTLRIEFSLYLFVMLFGYCGGFVREQKLCPILLVFSGLILGNLATMPSYTPLYLDLVGRHVSIIGLYIAFATGMSFEAGREALGRYPTFFVGTMLCFAIISVINNGAVYITPLIVAAITIAIGKGFKYDIGKNDYSYGIYIWGWLIEQMVSSTWPQLDPVPFVLISLALTLIPAIVSWHYIEIVALRFKPNRPK